MRKIAVIVFIVFIIISIMFIVKTHRLRSIPIPLDYPTLNIGTQLSDIISIYGTPSISYNCIKIWKHEKWIIVGGFKNALLDNYAVFDTYKRYINGTIEDSTISDLLRDIRSVSIEEMGNVYDTASGYTNYGSISKDGVVLLWSDRYHISVFDVRNTSYAETPLWIYRILRYF